MKDNKWLTKDIFNYKGDNFIDDDTSRNKIKKIEKGAYRYVAEYGKGKKIIL